MNQALSFDDVLIVPQYSEVLSRSTIDTGWDLKDFHFNIPILSANMDTITEYKMAAEMRRRGGLGVLHRGLTVEQLRQYIIDWSIDGGFERQPIAISVGSIYKDKAKLDYLLTYSNKPVILVVDMAHGHSIAMKDTLKYIKRLQWPHPVIAGNVCTARGVEDLLVWGANIVKVGVGPGSACITREKTGCGFPQFSTIRNCAAVGDIIADGGIRTAGDAAKALAAGAKAVMIGGMFKGTDCTPKWVGGGTMSFRGMASAAAKRACGGTEDYREGVAMQVHCRPYGSTQSVLNDICEGIRSAMSYSGSTNLDSFAENAAFVRVTYNTVIENSPHGTN
jgi:IMP dehydrogenase